MLHLGTLWPYTLILSYDAQTGVTVAWKRPLTMPNGSCSIHPTELRVHLFPLGPAGRLEWEGREGTHCCHLYQGWDRT